MNIKTRIAEIDKKKAAKKVVRFATAVTVTRTIKGVINNNVPQPENPVYRFALNGALWVGSGIVAGKLLMVLDEYSDQVIDDFFEPFELAQSVRAFNENEDVVEGTAL